MLYLATPSGENANFKSGCTTSSAFSKASASLWWLQGDRINLAPVKKKKSSEGVKSDQSVMLLHTKNVCWVSEKFLELFAV